MGKNRVRGMVGIGAGVLAVLGAAGPASGATVATDTSNSRLVVTGTGSDADVITIGSTGLPGQNQYVVVAPPFATTADADCTAVSLQKVSCTLASGLDHTAQVDAGAGADRVTMGTAGQVQFMSATLNGGDGSDVLTGGSDRDVLKGDDGSDTLTGRAGADTFVGGGGAGQPFKNHDDDTVSYADRTAPDVAVTVTIGDGPNDGAPGEGDDVQSDVEHLTGGAGDDHLTGSGNPNRIHGGDGDDEIVGAGGWDSSGSRAGGPYCTDTYVRTAGLYGDGGNDHLVGGDGPDALDGGSGEDALEGRGGADAYSSGYLHDCFITSTAGLVGGPGNDHLNAFDGFVDDVDCGEGDDAFVANAFDNLTACETDADVDRDGVDVQTDNCPATANPNQANNDGDGQGDACDADDDNDTVLDGPDNCPLNANSDQANHDTDALGDACDANDDGDALDDDADSCPLAAATTASGCPPASRKLTTSYSSSKRRFKGRLTSPAARCARQIEVGMWKVRRGADLKIGKATTGPTGKYRLNKRANRGKYYAVVDLDVAAGVAECAPRTSRKIRVR